MRNSTLLSYAGGFKEAAAEVSELEKAGLDVAWVPEAYSFNAPSAMGYLAARTERVVIASGILPIYSRTPTLLAMTAAGVDYLSDGRCMLGIGASGPQVIEGFHGIPYHAPVARIREICRMVWRREKVEYAGKHYELPLSANKGSGLGKALKLINHPVRDEIPITVAALGPKSVAMTAEIADGWLPAFYLPEGADEIWGDALRTGAAKRDPERAPLEVYSGGMVGIGEGLEAERDRMRSQIALYVGGMGAKEKNFYNQVFRRYGYEREADAIQSLYLEGRKDAAEAAIPEDYLARASLIGDPTFVRDRLQALKASGVTTLNVSFLGESRAARVRQCDCLRELVEQAA